MFTYSLPRLASSPHAQNGKKVHATLSEENKLSTVTPVESRDNLKQEFEPTDERTYLQFQ